MGHEKGGLGITQPPLPTAHRQSTGVAEPNRHPSETTTRTPSPCRAQPRGFVVDGAPAQRQARQGSGLLQLMKTRRLLACCALLVALLIPGVSATAEEKVAGVGSSLSSTTISGYVDSSVSGRISPAPDTAPHEGRGWWRKLLHWLAFNGRFDGRTHLR